MLFRKHPAPDPRTLLGRWRLVETEGNDDTGDGTTADFTADGRLTYTIHDGDKQQLIFLTWVVVGDFVVTNQPSHPSESRTRFFFPSPDRLVLELDGVQSHFVRDGHGIT